MVPPTLKAYTQPWIFFWNLKNYYYYFEKKNGEEVLEALNPLPNCCQPLKAYT
jgi:hypothetical protein